MARPTTLILILTLLLCSLTWPVIIAGSQLYGADRAQVLSIFELFRYGSRACRYLAAQSLSNANLMFPPRRAGVPYPLQDAM